MIDHDKVFAVILIVMAVIFASIYGASMKENERRIKRVADYAFVMGFYNALPDVDIKWTERDGRCYFDDVNEFSISNGVYERLNKVKKVIDEVFDLARSKQFN